MSASLTELAACGNAVASKAIRHIQMTSFAIPLVEQDLAYVRIIKQLIARFNCCEASAYRRYREARDIVSQRMTKPLSIRDISRCSEWIEEQSRHRPIAVFVDGESNLYCLRMTRYTESLIESDPSALIGVYKRGCQATDIRMDLKAACQERWSDVA